MKHSIINTRMTWIIQVMLLLLIVFLSVRIIRTLREEHMKQLNEQELSAVSNIVEI